MKPISLTRVRKFLQLVQFNPNLPGPIKIISDVNNPDYFENRAIEFIREAEFDYRQNYDEKIIYAIRLLILARETRIDKNKK
jgi:hypothetical protein